MAPPPPAKRNGGLGNGGYVPYRVLLHRERVEALPGDLAAATVVAVLAAVFAGLAVLPRRRRPVRCGDDGADVDASPVPAR